MTDRLSFGSGKEVMPYLKEGSETTLSVNLALTEAGNMGHIVPGHVYILKLVIEWAQVHSIHLYYVWYKKKTIPSQKSFMSSFV